MLTAAPTPVAVLGPNRYGRPELRLLRVDRRASRGGVAELVVGAELAGDLRADYLGEAAGGPSFEEQRRTLRSFVERLGGAPIEELASALAEHFVAAAPAIDRAAVSVTRYPWHGLGTDAFRAGGDAWHTRATCTGWRTWVVSGLEEVVGDGTDPVTIGARWGYRRPPAGWPAAGDAIRHSLLAAYAAAVEDREALPRTADRMALRVLSDRPEVAEVRVTLTLGATVRQSTVLQSTVLQSTVLQSTVRRPDGPVPADVW